MTETAAAGLIQDSQEFETVIPELKVKFTILVRRDRLAAEIIGQRLRLSAEEGFHLLWCLTKVEYGDGHFSPIVARA